MGKSEGGQSCLGEVFEFLAQLCAGAVNPGLDRAGTGVEGFSDFVVSKPLLLSK